MGDYFKNNSSICSFSRSDSWVILSDIEQSIKRKIEAVGTPLKDWNINIYRGILTGCNEAFIISGAKRDEILKNCLTEEERTKTAELIRPILRGRDIKRFGYSFADLWLINTHNGIKNKNIKPINVDEYPAIKKHLDKYWDKISKRDDKGVTPYNLRNCAYMEDFFQPKIIWKIIGNQMAFAYDLNNCFINNACYLMTGEHLEYLLSVLNSHAILWYSYVTNMNKTGVGDVQVGGQNIVTFPIPTYDKSKEKLVTLASKLTNEEISLQSVDSQIDNMVSDLFELTNKERNFLNIFASSLNIKVQ
jgi:hypothetical protein